MNKFILSGILISFALLACKKSSHSKTETSDKNAIPEERQTRNGEDAFRKDILIAINEQRSKGCNCGTTWMPAVPALTWNDQLGTAALLHSKDMIAENYFSHVAKDGSHVWDRVTKQGYAWSSVGENILMFSNYTKFATLTPVATIVNSWVKSEGHCKNLMSADFKQTGVAVAYNPEGATKTEKYTQVFASPK